MLRRAVRTQEFAVGLTVVLLALLIGAINPVFFSVGNLFDLLRSGTVVLLFALGALVVIASGGIDVSFTAVAVFALYSTVKILNGAAYEGGILVPFLLAAAIGAGLGLINGLLIALFKLPTLIVTLGTQSLFRGFLLFFVGATIIRDIPDAMTGFARSSLLTLTAPSGALVSLHVAVLLPLVACVATWLLLTYTMVGRSIYALGGAPEAAERAGFNIRRTQILIYVFVGLLAGVAGMTYGSLNRQANPFDLVGSELDVIAAVVLGGTSIFGGSGTIVGTVLGLILIQSLKNGLSLLGIRGDASIVAIGVVLIAAILINALIQRRFRS